MHKCKRGLYLYDRGKGEVFFYTSTKTHDGGKGGLIMVPKRIVRMGEKFKLVVYHIVFSFYLY